MIDLRLREFCKDRSGAAIIYATLMMPVFVGSLGLGAETGYRYYNQRLLQHAADFAAHAGAVRKYKGDDKPAIDAAALNVATGSEYAPAVGTITVNIPPTSGAFTGNPSAVEVILVETRPPLFSAIFSDEDVEIGARAVAAVTAAGSSGCILALSGTSPGAVTVTGNNTVNLTGCSVASNSTSGSAFSMPNGAAYLDAECISTVGGVSTNANAQFQTDDCLQTGAAAVQDPYYWVEEPPATCTGGLSRNQGQPNQITAIPPAGAPIETLPNGVRVTRFCNGLAAKGIVDLAPGLYIISGGTMTSSGATTAELRGTGVTFYFTNSAEVSIGATTTLNLSAPTSGPYSGILFFGSRNPVPATQHTFQGSETSVVQGAIYMPASEVIFRGNSAASSGCTQVIANTIRLTGDSDVTAECEDDGTEEILVGQVIAVVE